MVKAKDFIPQNVRIMDPADDPDAGLDKEFRQDTMFNQLGKVLDSRNNPKPITHVITDDGAKHMVNPRQANALRMLATSDKIKPAVKLQFTKDIQTSKGLKRFLDLQDIKQYVPTFVDVYMKDQEPYQPVTNY